MAKRGGIPPAVLSFAKKSSSVGSRDADDDDDRAFLLPSAGSSFNLTGDAEYLLPKSSSHHSNNSRSSRSAGGRSSGYASGSSGGSTHERRSRRHSSGGGGNGKKKKRASGQQRQYGYIREQSSSSVGSGSPAKSGGFPEQDGYGALDRQTDNTSLSPIHSERSYRSQRSTGSNRSGRSSRRRNKVRKEKRRREWVRRWRRRRLLGKMALSVIYSALLAYTLLVTVGPLLLSFRDPLEWCPYYWPDARQKDSGFSLGIDQLQRSRQKQQASGDDLQQRRRLTSEGVQFLTQDVKKVEIDLLRRTSKDVHNTPSGADEESSPKYENPDYDDHPCRVTRIPILFYLTLEECDLSRRMAASVLLGGFIGYERRASDRPAGIRTMALVSLGSCFFTISSQLAFRDSPMTWDSSRVTAAIPSGVGFLGAGLIWKGSLSDGSGAEVHQVHGITTAASVWLAAAVGVGAGGALYAVSAYSTALVILVLRFGPRLYLQHDKGFDYEDEDDDELEEDAEGESVYEDERKERTSASERDKTKQGQGYEMHQMGLSINDTTTLKRDAVQYGATDVEQNTVAQLLQGEQRRHMERLSRLDGGDTSNEGNPFLSWLTNLMPGKERQQPYNPYQEVMRDREVLRMMKQKKSMSKMSSRPSFCT